MKVNVLQVQNAEFRKKWCWWSNWVDVAVFTHGEDGYLLQMSVSRTNQKKFKVRSFTGFSLMNVGASTVGDLTQMKEGA